MCFHWAETALQYHLNEHHVRLYGTRRDTLHSYDNLGGNIFLSFIQLNRVYGSLCNFFPKNLTDDLDPPDDGLISFIKYWFGIFLHQWLWEDENIDRWEGTMTASGIRILINHLLAKAWGFFCEATGDLWKYFEQTGCLYYSNRQGR